MRCPLIYIVLTFGITALAQETPKPDLAREKLGQWVEAQKAVSKESAQWEQDKEMLLDLIDLREREASQMNEVIDLAKQRVTDVEKKSTELKGEELKRKQWRAQFEKRVTQLEDALIKQLPNLPNPVRNKMDESIARLKLENRDENDLQTRFRGLLAIMNECIAFNSEIHTLPEMQQIDGKQIEVDVIYLGMKQAWYVDRTNRYAAIGTPGTNGWTWQSDPSIANRVRKAFDIHTKKEAPTFVELPLTNGGGAK